MRDRYRRFLIVLVVPIVLLLPAGFANWLFLHNAGELTPIEAVAQIQQDEGGLYGTALHPNVYPYKLELYRARRPAVVAIGSSRVLQFRQHHFARPFTNLGRTVNYPAEAVKLVRDMLAISTPEVVLFGIDHYWLNPAFTTAPNFRTHDLRGGDLNPDALVTPFNWLVDGRIDAAAYRAFVAGTVPRAPNGAPLLGVQAIFDGAGFGPDGSWYYDHYIYGRRLPEDPEFRDTLRRIATGTAQFRYGDEIDPQRVRDLRTAIDVLRDAGVRVVTFVPPMATPVRAAMGALGDAYAYAEPARAAIADLDTVHADFLDATSIGVSDCEFIDGFHVGDVGAARLLGALANMPDSPLSNYIDANAIDETIKANAGHASADRRHRRNGEHEIDFLALGCVKNTT